MPPLVQDDIYLGELYAPELLEEAENVLVGQRGNVDVCVWPRISPHALLVAQTGGGKTTLLRVIVLDLLQDSLPKVLMLADGKEVGSFIPFEAEGGVRCADDAEAIVAMVEEVYQEMRERVRARKEYRRKAAKTRGPVEWTRPVTIYLFIDEYIGWLLLLDDAGDIVKKLGLILFQGREVGIRVLLSMQTPHAKAFDAGLSPVMKMNLDCRIGVPGIAGFDRTQSLMVFDYADARKLIPAVVGGGLAKIGGMLAPFLVRDYPDPTDPDVNMRLSREQRMRLWGALPSGGTRQRWIEGLEDDLRG